MLATGFDLPSLLSHLSVGHYREPGLPNCNRILVVGASHAARLADQTIAILHAGWPAGKTAAETLAADMSEKLSWSWMPDFILLQIFDNTAFYAKTFNGGLIPCRRELASNTYHVDGGLVLQPAEAFESLVEDCLPIFKACGGHRVIMLSPLPRFITPGCCV